MKFLEQVIVKHHLINDGKVLPRRFTVISDMLDNVILNGINQCLQVKLVGGNKNAQNSMDIIFRQCNFASVDESFFYIFFSCQNVWVLNTTCRINKVTNLSKISTISGVMLGYDGK